MKVSAPTCIPRTLTASLLSLVALGFCARAHAAPSPGDRARTVLDTLAAGEAGGLEAAAELAELAPRGAPEIVEVLVDFLGRERTSTEAQRREVLLAINADVPDERGRFRSSRRREPVNRGDDFDWLGNLVELDTSLAGLGDVLADVAAIRALAASEHTRGANALLNFGFSERGTLYRDECGRYLRKMAPYSLPALIAASQNRRKRWAIRRYANYQLDRMDRQDPNKAMNHASEDPALLVEVIEAYGKSKHREAVVPLIARIDDSSPATRDAARTALLGYVTGREPPEAPKRKLTLPGGKLTEEEEPLWLTYRELADVELRREYKRVLGERAPRRLPPAKVARRLFAHYDELREEAQAEAFAAALAQAEAGQWAEATEAFDRLLAERPDHPERARMARAYYEHARALAQAGSYRDAAAAYSKAHGLDPGSAFANDALAGHYMALGKALEAEGKDGSTALRRARAIEPDVEQRQAGPGLHTGDRQPTWMLYAGLGGGAGALILFILGLAVRRR